MSELQALLARVEAATGADQRDLLLAAGEHLIPYGQQEDGGYAWWSLVIGYIDAGAYTDAALALARRALPTNVSISVTSGGDGRGACEMWVWAANRFEWAREHNRENGHEHFHQNVGGETPALSILEAMLKTLLSTEAQPSVCEQGEQGNPATDEPIPHPDTRGGEG